MVRDSAQIQRRGALDFTSYYDFSCAKQDLVPLSSVTANLDKGILDFNGDRITLKDWSPILNAIAINKHLHHIAIRSKHLSSQGSGDGDRRYYKSMFKKTTPVLCSGDMTLRLCKALRDCLTVSPNLKTLQLQGLPLKERDLITLTKGLEKTVSLENISLANCPIRDDGVEVICQSIKYSANIKAVDFTGCSLTWQSAEHIANIIKYQGMQRHGTAWTQSLRYRQPKFEGMGGLRRVTLNSNSLIGDRGAAALAHELAEDLWLKALDLQNCGLSNEGARRLLELLKTNSALCVLDIRSNHLVEKKIVKTIIEKVLMTGGHSSEYCWISPAAAPPPKAVVTKRRASHSRGGTTVRVSVESDSEDVDRASAEREPGSSFRLREDRIAGRQLGRLQMELKECRLRLAEERRARLRAQSRLMEYELENGRLRDSVVSLKEALAAAASVSARPASGGLEEESVLEAVERSFTKFHAFLDLLKDAGLGQLSGMAGIEDSDFHPLGVPGLSSTVVGPVGDHSGVAGPVGPVGPARSGGGPPVFQDDGSLLERNTQPARPDDPAEIRTFSPASSAGERRPKAALYEASRPPGVSGAGGETQPDRFSKADTEDDTDSRCGYRNGDSFGKFSPVNNCQSRPSPPGSRSSSHGGPSHRGHGPLKRGFPGGDPSRSGRADCGSSLRSSASDKSGSAVSGDRELERLVAVGGSSSGSSSSSSRRRR